MEHLEWANQLVDGHREDLAKIVAKFMDEKISEDSAKKEIDKILIRQPKSYVKELKEMVWSD